jgi:hypothetical protein
MPTLVSSADRQAVLERLRRLRPDSRPSWGELSAQRMVCHLSDSLRVALGDVAAQRVDTVVSRTLVKWLVVYSPVKPPPEKIQTAPEMMATAPTTWAQDLATLESLLARAGTTPSAATHPYFGPLSPDGWGRLGWKHIDHHLRQFGC